MAENKKKPEHLDVAEAVTKSEAFIEKNKNLLLGGLAVLILIVAGYVSYNKWYAEPREAEAQAALFPGQNYFEQDAFEQALKGDSLGYIGFLAIEDTYSGTDAANLARAYAGICYQRLGDNDNAIAQLRAFKGSDLMVAPALLGLIGNCYADLGKLDDAVKYLEQGAKAADNNTLSPIYLIQAGLIYEKQGKYADAVRVYTVVKEKYFGSYQASMDIDKYIERAKLQQK
jgi:tetratricopeptide (TPR) repeat protein